MYVFMYVCIYVCVYVCMLVCSSNVYVVYNVDYVWVLLENWTQDENVSMTLQKYVLSLQDLFNWHYDITTKTAFNDFSYNINKCDIT